MSFASPLDVARFARRHCPYYRQVYRGLADDFSWDEVPVLDKEAYWQRRGESPEDFRTSELFAGYVWRTSGSTSQGRSLEISREDFDEEIDFVAPTFLTAGLQPGERVANLFAAGDLRASFLLTTRCLQAAGLVELPILLDTPVPRILDALQRWQPSAIIGIPSTLELLADELENRGECLAVKTVLYTGEHLYADQRPRLRALLGCDRLGPLVYGAVDTGPVATPAGENETAVYRAIPGFAYIELADDHGHPIVEPGCPGHLVITNLSRRLSPVVRYPVGDQACWVESAEDGRFELLERSYGSLRVGASTVDHSSVSAALAGITGLGEALQLVARRRDGREQLICRCLYSGTVTAKPGTAATVRSTLLDEYPFFETAASRDHGFELVVDLASADGFIYRSGKRPGVIDERSL